MNINEFGLCSSWTLGGTATGVGEKRQLMGKKNDKCLEKVRSVKKSLYI